MAKIASAIQSGTGSPQHVAQEVAPLRPGWIYEIVVAVLSAANQPLRPQEVIHRAERLHGHRIAPSSVRNCLREASKRPDSRIARLGYGRYGSA